jgi:hypothetical protein
MLQLILEQRLVFDKNYNVRIVRTYVFNLWVQQLKEWFNIVKSKYGEPPKQDLPLVIATKDEIVIAFNKIKSTILTCKHIQQLDVCEAMIQQFNKLYQHKYTNILFKLLDKQRKCIYDTEL